MSLAGIFSEFRNDHAMVVFTSTTVFPHTRQKQLIT
jgi:hypothetical protein